MNEATCGFSRAVRRGDGAGAVQARSVLPAAKASVWRDEEALTNTMALVLETDSFVLLNLCTNMALVFINLCTHIALILVNLCIHVKLMLLNLCAHVALVLLNLCIHVNIMLLN